MQVTHTHSTAQCIWHQPCGAFLNGCIQLLYPNGPRATEGKEGWREGGGRGGGRGGG